MLTERRVDRAQRSEFMLGTCDGVQLCGLAQRKMAAVVRVKDPWLKLEHRCKQRHIIDSHHAAVLKSDGCKESQRSCSHDLELSDQQAALNSAGTNGHRRTELWRGAFISLDILETEQWIYINPVNPLDFSFILSDKVEGVKPQVWASEACQNTDQFNRSGSRNKPSSQTPIKTRSHTWNWKNSDSLNRLWTLHWLSRLINMFTVNSHRVKQLRTSVHIYMCCMCFTSVCVYQFCNIICILRLHVTSASHRV